MNFTVAEFPQIAAQVDGSDVRVPSAPRYSACRALRVEREIVRVEVRDPNTRRLLDEHGEVRKLDDLEAEAIRFALAHYRGQMSEMATSQTGIGRSTLYRQDEGIRFRRSSRRRQMIGEDCTPPDARRQHRPSGKPGGVSPGFPLCSVRRRLGLTAGFRRHPDRWTHPNESLTAAYLASPRTGAGRDALE